MQRSAPNIASVSFTTGCHSCTEHSCANGAVPDWLYVAVPYELALLEVDSREVAIARWTVLHY